MEDRVKIRRRRMRIAERTSEYAHSPGPPEMGGVRDSERDSIEEKDREEPPWIQKKNI